MIASWRHPRDRIGEVEDHRRDGPGVLEVHPMAAPFNDFDVGFDKARTDRADELFGHERVRAAADDQYRAAECTRCARVAHTVVPNFDVVGDNIGCHRRADVGEPVELFFAEVGRQLRAQTALCSAVTAKGAKRRDRLVKQVRTAQRARPKTFFAGDCWTQRPATFTWIGTKRPTSP